MNIRLKQKLVSINKYQVLLQCKFDEYTAKYISDIVKYNKQLPYKWQYNKIVKELKCKLILFYYTYNTNKNQQLLCNKIVRLIFKHKKFEKIYQLAISDFDFKLNNFDEYCDIGYFLFPYYLEFIRNNTHYTNYLQY